MRVAAAGHAGSVEACRLGKAEGCYLVGLEATFGFVSRDFEGITHGHRSAEC
jgi:hypothetical protein